MNTITRIVLFFIVTILVACNNKKEPTLKAGDLLFQQIDCGPLCDAINKVTDGYNGKDYNHCGMVVQQGDSLAVIEAIGKQVSIHSLAEFYKRVGDDTNKTKQTLHMRLKPAYQSLIPKATAAALTYVGQEYDDVFILNNGKMYCSEVLFEAFSSANNGNPLFTCQPMTYKDPETKKFFGPWVDYYKELQYPIPEGEPGINPGLISRSDKLELVNE